MPLVTWPLFVMLVALMLAAPACGGGSPTGEVPEETGAERDVAEASPMPTGEPGTTNFGITDLGILFPKQEGGGSILEALKEGFLFVDDRGCLRVGIRNSRSAQVAVWQPDQELGIDEGGEVVVLDDTGGVVATVGGRVRMSGGEVSRIVRGEVDERTKAELVERCPGLYWLVGKEVQVVGQ